MRKYTLGDYPELTLDFYTDAKSFGAGTQFDMPDLKEKIKEVDRGNGKITVIGENYTKCSITAPEGILDKIELILKDYIGAPIRDIENIEID